MTLKEYYASRKQIRKNIKTYVENNTPIDLALNDFHKEYESKMTNKQKRVEKFYNFWFRLFQKLSSKKKTNN